LERWLKGALEVELLSLWELCEGTWREGSLAGDLVGYERKALETGISLHGGSVGQPGADLSTVEFERWLKGALEVEFLYGSSVREPGGRAPLLGTL
jgi:hypothetical protein